MKTNVIKTKIEVTKDQSLKKELIKIAKKEKAKFLSFWVADHHNFEYNAQFAKPCTHQVDGKTQSVRLRGELTLNKTTYNLHTHSLIKCDSCYKNNNYVVTHSVCLFDVKFLDDIIVEIKMFDKPQLPEYKHSCNIDTIEIQKKLLKYDKKIEEYSKDCLKLSQLQWVYKKEWGDKIKLVLFCHLEDFKYHTVDEGRIEPTIDGQKIIGHYNDQIKTPNKHQLEHIKQREKLIKKYGFDTTKYYGHYREVIGEDFFNELNSKIRNYIEMFIKTINKHFEKSIDNYNWKQNFKIDNWKKIFNKMKTKYILTEAWALANNGNWNINLENDIKDIINDQKNQISELEKDTSVSRIERANQINKIKDKTPKLIKEKLELVTNAINSMRKITNRYDNSIHNEAGAYWEWKNRALDSYFHEGLFVYNSDENKKYVNEHKQLIKYYTNIDKFQKKFIKIIKGHKLGPELSKINKEYSMSLKEWQELIKSWIAKHEKYETLISKVNKFKKEIDKLRGEVN